MRVLYWGLLKAMELRVETEQEVDGRWIAEVVNVPGALAYGKTKLEAVAKAEAIAFRALADRLENGEIDPLDAEAIPFRVE